MIACPVQGCGVPAVVVQRDPVNPARDRFECPHCGHSFTRPAPVQRQLSKRERVDIYAIKRRYIETAEKAGRPAHYFDRGSLRFFGQTLKSFSVVKVPGVPDLYELSAPMRDKDGRNMGTSRRFFDWVTGELHHEHDDEVRNMLV